MNLLFVETNRSLYLSTVQFSKNQPPPYPPPYTFPCNPYQMLSITTYTVSPSTSAATTTSASSSCRSKYTSSLNDKTTFPRVPCYATRCAVRKSLSPYILARSQERNTNIFCIILDGFAEMHYLFIYLPGC